MRNKPVGGPGSNQYRVRGQSKSLQSLVPPAIPGKVTMISPGQVRTLLWSNLSIAEQKAVKKLGQVPPIDVVDDIFEQLAERPTEITEAFACYAYTHWNAYVNKESDYRHYGRLLTALLIRVPSCPPDILNGVLSNDTRLPSLLMQFHTPDRPISTSSWRWILDKEIKRSDAPDYMVAITPFVASGLDTQAINEVFRTHADKIALPAATTQHYGDLQIAEVTRESLNVFAAVFTNMPLTAMAAMRIDNTAELQHAIDYVLAKGAHPHVMCALILHQNTPAPARAALLDNLRQRPTDYQDVVGLLAALADLSDENIASRVLETPDAHVYALKNPSCTDQVRALLALAGPATNIGSR